ncbi:MAG: glutaredoxin domain-containing protein [Caldilineales bacterium]
MAPAEIVMLATPWCGDTRLARRVLDELGITYDFVDFSRDEPAARRVEQITGGFRSSPTILFPDGSVLIEPAARILREKIETLQAAGYHLGTV